MEYLSAGAWGFGVFAVMTIVIKYGLPHLAERSKDKGKYPPDKKTLLFLPAAAAYAAICGYTAYGYVVSPIGWMRLFVTVLALAAVVWTDAVFMLIPNAISFSLFFAGVLLCGADFVFDAKGALYWLAYAAISLVVSFLSLFVIAKLTKGGLGYGDVKALCGVSFVCGIRAGLFTMFFAFVLCALVSGVCLLLKKKNLKDLLPLGPFLWMGFGVAVILATV